MTSNIEVQRICQHCGKEFIARTTVTKFCGDQCAKRAYKLRKREEKITQSNVETAKIKIQSIEELNLKPFLSVREVAELIGCSRQTVYNLINSKKLKATNISIKKTLIRRSDLEKIFD